MIAGAYAVFADRAASAKTPGTKQQRVREHILRHAPARFRLADIRTAMPGVSDQAIRLVLEQLKNEGQVRADGTGRGATWIRTHIAPSGFKEFLQSAPDADLDIGRSELGSPPALSP